MPAALEAVDRHPRHVLLFALAAGLLTGPISPLATIVAAAAAFAVTLAAVLSRPAAVESSPAAVASSPAAVSSLMAVLSPLPALAAAAVLVGGTVADLRIAALEGGPLPHLHGRSITARAVLLEPVRERVRGPAVVRARLLGGAVDGEVAVLRVREQRRAWPGVGEIVVVAGTVAPLGGFDAYQRRRRATAAVDVSALHATGARRGGMAGFVDAARRRAEAGLARGLPEGEAALLRGMVLGQDERLSEDVRDDFERSGLAHVLAVSGQNVMLLATLVLAAGAAFGVPLRTRLVLALALVAFYVPLTGAGPSIQRAGVMGAAGLVAALAGRPAHRWYALGLAAAVTLILNPRAAGEPGWQLSFAAVVALLALVPGLRDVLARRMPGPVADVAAMTLAATLGTAPLMALHFEQVSLAALPANLLAAAAIAPVMWLGMLAAAAAQVAPALAVPFNVLNGPLLAFVEWVAHTLAAAPGAALPVRLGSPVALIGAYAALAAALLGVRAAWRRAEASRLDPLAMAALALVPFAVLGCATALDDDTVVPPGRGELVVSFLDVGQGDATLLQMEGVAVLVDTGPPDGPILRRLDEAGVRRLDALVITHAQSDHEGAALEVLRRVPTRLVVNGGAGWPSPVQDGLRERPHTPGRRPRGPGAHARRDPHADALATAGRTGLPCGGRPQPARPRGTRPGRRLRPSPPGRRRVGGHGRAPAAGRRSAQGRAPRERRRGSAGAARTHPARVRGDRGRPRQLVRPSSALDAGGAPRRRPRRPHRPGRHDPPPDPRR